LNPRVFLCRNWLLIWLFSTLWPRHIFSLSPSCGYSSGCRPMRWLPRWPRHHCLLLPQLW
jgi:hypothetical protein